MRKLTLYRPRLNEIPVVASLQIATLYHPHFARIRFVISPTTSSLNRPRFSVDSLVISSTPTSLYHPQNRLSKPRTMQVSENVTRARLLTLIKSLTRKPSTRSEGWRKHERPAGRLAAVQVSIGNIVRTNFSGCFGRNGISKQVSTMRPWRPHPDCVRLGNCGAIACRNSGQNKVAAQRASRLILSPRCDDLAGDPSLSSYIDALVPAALRSEVLWVAHGQLKAQPTTGGFMTLRSANGKRRR